ncbi:MAG: hypothetical protein V3R33_10100 [Anaerolineales bacterium]|jgi:hypothetical protein
MSNQTPNQSSKSFSDPQESSKDQGPMNPKQEPQRKNNDKYHVPDRMETFPKTRTFPKKWDLSSFSKKQK